MSRRRRLASRLGVVILAVGLGAAASMMNACSSEPDGVTPACGGYPDYDAAAPDVGATFTPAPYDSNCYTAPGTAATITTTGTGGAGGSS
jgi:hypothetical protein